MRERKQLGKEGERKRGERGGEGWGGVCERKRRKEGRVRKGIMKGEKNG